MSSVITDFVGRGTESEAGAGNEKPNGELGGKAVIIGDVVVCGGGRTFPIRGSSPPLSSPSESVSESSYSFKSGNGETRGEGEAGKGTDTAASSTVSSSNVVPLRAASARMSSWVTFSDDRLVDAVVKKSRAGILPLPLTIDVGAGSCCDDGTRDSGRATAACLGSVDGVRGVETSVALPFAASGTVGCGIIA